MNVGHACTRNTSSAAAPARLQPETRGRTHAVRRRRRGSTRHVTTTDGRREQREPDPAERDVHEREVRRRRCRPPRAPPGRRCRAARAGAPRRRRRSRARGRSRAAAGAVTAQPRIRKTSSASSREAAGSAAAASRARRCGRSRRASSVPSAPPAGTSSHHVSPRPTRAFIASKRATGSRSCTAAARSASAFVRCGRTSESCGQDRHAPEDDGDERDGDAKPYEGDSHAGRRRSPRSAPPISPITAPTRIEVRRERAVVFAAFAPLDDLRPLDVLGQDLLLLRGRQRVDRLALRRLRLVELDREQELSFEREARLRRAPCRARRSGGWSVSAAR